MLPVSSIVLVDAAEIDEDRSAEVTCGDKKGVMFSQDLRTRAELVTPDY